MLFLPEFPWSDLHTLNLDWILSVVASHERQLRDIEGSASPYDEAPLADGIADPGTANQFARGDHRHPTDTTRASVTALQAVQDTVPGPSNGSPRMDGTANPGTYTYYSRADHVHPSDTSKLDKTGGDVDGLLNILPRRSFATLSAPGWYRIITYTGISAAEAVGDYGRIFDIKLLRRYNNGNNEVHRVKLLNPYNVFNFTDEISVSNTQYFTKIRATVNETERKTFIDVYYDSERENSVAAFFDFYTAVQIAEARAVSNAFIPQVESPANEVVKASHNLIATGHNYTLSIYKNGTLLH